MFSLFELKNLHELEGGKVNAAFNKHIARASADCKDRPLDGKPRVVTLQFELTPDPDQHGNCDKINLKVQAASKVPSHKTKPISLGLKHSGAMFFNVDSEDDVDQGSLPYGPGKQGEEPDDDE